MTTSQLLDLPTDPVSSGVVVEFTESAYLCPNGTDHGLWTAPWWDDPPSHGGAVIGSWVFCRTCAYEDWW